MADRFYINSPLGIGPVLLQGPEAHHVAHVLRVHPGDLVLLFNGDGHEYTAEVTRVDRRHVEFQVHDRSTPQRELGFELVVAAPIPKGDRAQFLIEKLTELGVTRFFPLRTTRSIINPRESKLERFERYVIEASKQCGRNVLMAIEPLAEWSEFCQRSDLPAERRLAHVGATRAPVTTTGDVVCAVGPEGGFTDIEVQSALDHGWQLVELGPRILRIETAALVIAALARFTPLRP